MTAQAISEADVAAAKGLLDVETFAERVLGRPLWEHQAAVARSPARYRVLLAGRQAGKSAMLSVLALHRATVQRGARVLIVSAGESASRRVLADVAGLATASPLAGSVLDEQSALVTLSNGSTILSVPSSTRQIRGQTVDLLILDEAAFIDEELWRGAAEPTTIARRGARVVLASSPWGSDHFFRRLWNRGHDSPDAEVESWHWPSSISPLVDEHRLETIRAHTAPDVFEREYEAHWTDESGAYFSESELMAAVADYAGPDPADGDTRSWPVCGGVDWGQARDAHALVLLAALDPAESSDRRARLWLPFVEAAHRTPYDVFIRRIVEVTGRFRTRVVASETNGVGAYPTQDLAAQLRGRHTPVAPVTTTARRKQTGFGMMRVLLQSGRLLLPREPELLKQLRALEFEQLPGGTLRIAVPESAGHDDLALAFVQAMSCVRPARLVDRPGSPPVGPDLVTTAGGVSVPSRPRAAESWHWIVHPRGADHGDGW